MKPRLYEYFTHIHCSDKRAVPHAAPGRERLATVSGEHTTLLYDLYLLTTRRTRWARSGISDWVTWAAL
jgi:hypothetical protein